MLIIFRLILLNLYIFSSISNASFLSFFKNIASSNNNTEQVLDKNNKPIELKVQVDSSILEQIKEINNIINDKNNNNNKIKDDNFNTIQTQQQQILGVLGSYYCNREAFNECIIKVKSITSVIDFYNILFRKRNDFSKLIIELNDILSNAYQKSINKLYKQFDKILDIINLIKLIFSDKSNDDLINKLLLLDNTLGLNENEIKEILNKYIYQLDVLLSKDTKEYYNNILSEVNVKMRLKKSVLPSQVLFILFYNIREELFSKNNELHELYISFKNKITLINQKLDSINDDMKNKVQLSDNNSIDNKKNPEEAIVTFINSNIKEQNRSNNDVMDEIERIMYIINSIIKSLDIFKNYVPDERILSAVEQAKLKQKNTNRQIENHYEKDTKKNNNKESKSEQILNLEQKNTNKNNKQLIEVKSSYNNEEESNNKENTTKTECKDKTENNDKVKDNNKTEYENNKDNKKINNNQNI